MATHPSYLVGWISNDQSEVRHVLGDNRSGPDKGITPDGDPADNRGIGSDSTTALQPGGLIQRVPVHLGTRVSDIRQDT